MLDCGGNSRASLKFPNPEFFSSRGQKLLYNAVDYYPASFDGIIEAADAELTQLTMQEVLDDNPHVLGAIRWKGDLPFLFKVISISKALSIQAHPDKVRLREETSMT